MIDSSKWNIIEAGLKCIHERVVNSISLKEGEAQFIKQGQLIKNMELLQL